MLDLCGQLLCNTCLTHLWVHLLIVVLLLLCGLESHVFHSLQLISCHGLQQKVSRVEATSASLAQSSPPQLVRHPFKESKAVKPCKKGKMIPKKSPYKWIISPKPQITADMLAIVRKVLTRGQNFRTSTAINNGSGLIIYGSGIFIYLFNT